MTTLSILGSVVGLGVAGLDPVAPFVVMPALAAGVRRRTVLLFFVTIGVFTLATGLALGSSVQFLTSWLETLIIPTSVRLVGQALAAVGLGAWAAYRFAHRRETSSGKKTSLIRGPVMMILLGALWGVSSTADPSFLALATIDSQNDDLVASLAIFAGWILVSQLPLGCLMLALMAGRDSAPVQRALGMIQRLAAPAAMILTAALAVASVLLVVNIATFLTEGSFWPV